MTSSPYENPQDPNQPGPNQPGPNQPSPYQQDPGSKFGTNPYDPAAVGGPLAEPAKYGLLKKLTLASLALYVLYSIFSVMSSTDQALIEEQLAAQGVPYDQDMIETAMVIGVITAAALSLISVVLYLVVYLGIAKVKNWGRILGIVFAIIGLVFSAFNMFGAGALIGQGGVGIISLVLLVAMVAVNIYWLLTAFNKEVGAYFAQGKVG